MLLPCVLDVADNIFSKMSLLLSGMRTGDQGDTHGARSTLMERYGNAVRTPVRPIGLSNGEAGLGATVSQIRRVVHLNPHLFGEPRCLWVASGYKNTSVVQKLK